MQPTVFTLMFLASAPIFLVPSFIAHFSRRGHTLKVGSVNFLLWALLYLTVRSVISDSPGLADNPAPRPGLPFQPSVAVLLISWLVLLRYAIVGGARHLDSETTSTHERTSGFPGHASSNDSSERAREEKSA